MSERGDWLRYKAARAVERNQVLEADNLRFLAEELERLQAIVDALPKCWRLSESGELVQDWPVVPDAVIFVRLRSVVNRPILAARVLATQVDRVAVEPDLFPQQDVMLTDCFDTREAAEALAKRRDDGGTTDER